MNEEHNEEFGQRIRTRREELEITQNDLSDRLGVRQQTVSRWEAGFAIPRPRRVHELALELQIPARELQVLAGHMDQGLAMDRVEVLDRIQAKFGDLSDENQKKIEGLIDALRGGKGGP